MSGTMNAKINRIILRCSLARLESLVTIPLNRPSQSNPTGTDPLAVTWAKWLILFFVNHAAEIR